MEKKGKKSLFLSENLRLSEARVVRPYGIPCLELGFAGECSWRLHKRLTWRVRDSFKWVENINFIKKEMTRKNFLTLSKTVVQYIYITRLLSFSVYILNFDFSLI